MFLSDSVHLQELDEESVQLRRHMDRDGKSHPMAKSEAVVGLERASQVLNASKKFWTDVFSGPLFLRHRDACWAAEEEGELTLITSEPAKLVYSTESRTSLAFLTDPKRVQQFDPSTVIPLRLFWLQQKVLHILSIDFQYFFQDLMTTPSTTMNTWIWRSIGRRATRYFLVI